MRQPLLYLPGRAILTSSRSNILGSLTTISGAGNGNSLSGFFVSPFDFTASYMTCLVSTAIASSTCYMAIRSPATNGYPGALLRATGSFNTDTTGRKTVALTSTYDIVKDTGYWLELVVSSGSIVFQAAAPSVAEIGSLSLGTGAAPMTVGNNVAFGSPVADLAGDANILASNLIELGLVLP